MTIESLLPPSSLKQARKLYSGVLNWEYFLKKFPGQIVVRDTLHQTQRGRCLYCEKNIRSAHDAEIHHLDYNHFCKMEKSLIKTKKSLCSFCKENFYENFAACIKVAALLHRNCHYQIHQYAINSDLYRG